MSSIWLSDPQSISTSSSGSALRECLEEVEEKRLAHSSSKSSSRTCLDEDAQGYVIRAWSKQLAADVMICSNGLRCCTILGTPTRVAGFLPGMPGQVSSRAGRGGQLQNWHLTWQTRPLLKYKKYLKFGL
ncbi:hypothetical protein PM082_007055 [Marasmius tenuissimus]|nr:hypothetical protein PM082_007055 [Marasmius tenuissimus]